MQGYTMLFMASVLYITNARLRHRAFHHPERPAAQLAYGLSRWLVWLAVTWWIVTVTPIVLERFPLVSP